MDKKTLEMVNEWVANTEGLPAKTRINLFEAFMQYAMTGNMPELPTKDMFIFKLLLKVVTNKFACETHTHEACASHTPVPYDHVPAPSVVADAATTTNSNTTTNTTTQNYCSSSNSNEVKEVVCGAPCTEEELASYFAASKLPNAKDQAHQCYAFNEARGWMQGGKRITTRDGWHWIAQCWMRQAAKFPVPPKAPLTEDEMAENRRLRDEAEARAKAKKAIEERWNDVRNIVCLEHKDDYMTVFHPITIVGETDTQVQVRMTEDVYQRLITEPYRTSILNAVKRVYGNKELRALRQLPKS